MCSRKVSESAASLTCSGAGGSIARSSLEIGIEEIMCEVRKVSVPLGLSVITLFALPFECLIDVTEF